MKGKYIFDDCMNHLPKLADNTYDLGLIDVQWGIGEDGRIKKAYWS